MGLLCRGSSRHRDDPSDTAVLGRAGGLPGDSLPPTTASRAGRQEGGPRALPTTVLEGRLGRSDHRQNEVDSGDFPLAISDGDFAEVHASSLADGRLEPEGLAVGADFAGEARTGPN